MDTHLVNLQTGKVFKPIKVEQGKKTGRKRYFDGNSWIIDLNCEELSTPVQCKLWRDRWIEGYRLITIKNQSHLSHTNMSLADKCIVANINGCTEIVALDDLRITK